MAHPGTDMSARAKSTTMKQSLGGEVSLPQSGLAPSVSACRWCFLSPSHVLSLVSVQTIIIAPVMTGFVASFIKSVCLNYRTTAEDCFYFCVAVRHMQAALLMTRLMESIYSSCCACDGHILVRSLPCRWQGVHVYSFDRFYCTNACVCNCLKKCLGYSWWKYAYHVMSFGKPWMILLLSSNKGLT